MSNEQIEIKRALIFTLHPEQALPVVRALGRHNISSFFVGEDRRGIHKYSRFCKTGFLTTKSSLECGDKLFIDKVNTFIENNNIDILIGTDADTTRMLIANQDSWTNIRLFPSPDIDVFDLCNDKWSFANYLNDLGLPQPKSFLLETIDDYRESLLPFPILLKPRIGAGSIGIQKIDSFSSLEATMRKIEEENKLPIIMQEFLVGKDIDFNFLADNGKLLTWSIQMKTDVAKGEIRFLENDDVYNNCREFIEKSKYTGVGHIDLRFDDREGRVKFIEINPRFWGSLDYSTAMGINFPYLGIQLLLNRPIPVSGPFVGDCPYLPISLKAVIKKLIGHKVNLNNLNLESWAKFLWSDPLPELVQIIRRHIPLAGKLI